MLPMLFAAFQDTILCCRRRFMLRFFAILRYAAAVFSAAAIIAMLMQRHFDALLMPRLLPRYATRRHTITLFFAAAAY